MYKQATNLSVQRSTERPYVKHVQSSNKLVSTEEYREAICKACTSKQQTCQCRGVQRGHMLSMYKQATNLSVQRSTERSYVKHVQASNKLVSTEECREAICKACTSKQQFCKCRGVQRGHMFLYHQIQHECRICLAAWTPHSWAYH